MRQWNNRIQHNLHLDELRNVYKNTHPFLYLGVYLLCVHKVSKCSVCLVFGSISRVKPYPCVIQLPR